VKILIIRFSSIGDIVLTTPVIRCVKKQIQNAEVHFLTKSKFLEIVTNNPYIDKIITIDNSIDEVLKVLKKQNYDYVIDLHNNLRTLKLKKTLAKTSFSFPKLNIQKWIYVNFKINKLPNIHIVDRYFKAVEKLNVVNDLQPCDYYLSDSDFFDVKKQFKIDKFMTIALGAQFYTKRIPLSLLIKIVENKNLPIVFLGDLNDKKIGDELINNFPDKTLINLCGSLSLNQSASVLKQSELLLTGDTGLMHIASAFQIKTISVWGNTVPDFGMYPYFPTNKEMFSIHEVNELKCRPCSKIGFQECPKKHFSCMNLQNTKSITQNIENYLIS
jgi:ADP-heptose:LPS heptosyltransferase